MNNTETRNRKAQLSSGLPAVMLMLFPLLSAGCSSAVEAIKASAVESEPPQAPATAESQPQSVRSLTDFTRRQFGYLLHVQKPSTIDITTNDDSIHIQCKNYRLLSQDAFDGGRQPPTTSDGQYAVYSAIFDFDVFKTTLRLSKAQVDTNFPFMPAFAMISNPALEQKSNKGKFGIEYELTFVGIIAGDSNPSRTYAKFRSRVVRFIDDTEVSNFIGFEYFPGITDTETFKSWQQKVAVVDKNSKQEPELLDPRGVACASWEECEVAMPYELSSWMDKYLSKWKIGGSSQRLELIIARGTFRIAEPPIAPKAAGEMP